MYPILRKHVLSDLVKLVVVGLAVVAQQTPLAVIAAPLSVVMFPPDVAVVVVMELAAVVVRLAIPNEKVISAPLEVPLLLVAFKR